MTPEVSQAALVRFEEFKKFHSDNPHVYAYFVKFAKQARSKGYLKFSARMIAHQIRWTVLMETINNDGFKIPNNYVSFYSRKMMEDHEEFEDFFRVAESLADPFFGRL